MYCLLLRIKKLGTGSFLKNLLHYLKNFYYLCLFQSINTHKELISNILTMAILSNIFNEF